VSSFRRPALVAALAFTTVACGRSDLFSARRCAAGDLACQMNMGKDAGADGGHADGGPPPCAQMLEICGNERDDNCNGLADCDDPACFGNRACTPIGVEICNNGLDDDDDGLVDCADPDCASNRICIPVMGREVCDNGIDDNGDKLVDCSDPQCVAFPACLAVSCHVDVTLGALAAHGGSVSAGLDTSTGTRSFATCAPSGGQALVAEVSLAETSDVRLDFAQVSGAAHVVALYRAGAGQACDQNPVDCLTVGQSPTAAHTFAGLAAGVYRVIVQSYPGTQGPTKLTLSTGSTGQPEICGNGIDDDGNGLTDCQDSTCVAAPVCAASECVADANVGALVVGATPKTVMVDTASSTDRYLVSCAGKGAGADRAVAFSLPEAGGVEVMFRQAGDHAFAIFQVPPPGEACDFLPLSCAYLGQSAGDFAYDSLPAGKYLLIAKATSPAQEGPLLFRLSAFGNRKVEICSNGIDDDGNGLTDCADPACAGVGGCTPTGCTPDYDLGSFSWGTQRSISLPDLTSAKDLYDTTCGMGNGKEQVIRLTITQPMTLGLDCSQTGSQVFELSEQLNALDACDAHNVNCGDPEVLPFGCSYGIPNLQPGKYNLIVEAFAAGTEGSVDLTLTGIPETVREICDNGIDDDGDGAIDCADLKCVAEPSCATLACRTQDTFGLLPLDGSPKTIVVQTSKGMDDQRTAACTSEPGGQDTVVDFQLPATADVTIQWAQQGNHALAVYSDRGTLLPCDAGTARACIATMGELTGSQVLKALPMGRYHLVVDADHPGSEGGVVLQLSGVVAM